MSENHDASDTGGTGRDEQGRFAKGNGGGPGRPAGRRDRINAALDALRDHYRAGTQADALRAFVREILAGMDDTGERLDLLRLLLPLESSADVEVTNTFASRATPEELDAAEAKWGARVAALKPTAGEHVEGARSTQ